MLVPSYTPGPSPNPSTPRRPAPPRDSTPPNDSASPSTRSPAPHPSLELAQQHQVSRKFVYQQAHKAQQALDRRLHPDPPARDDRVLFYLPVTKAWIRQFVLALVLIGHSSFRGVTELLRDLFDYHLSLGTVHNIVAQAVATARPINERQDLSRVRIGADDEIFQAGRPVLVGVDTESTYCYLLSQEEHRDADTWGVRLLELADRGFAPEATVADFASGLRAGHEQALPGVACRGDVFHALNELGPLVRYLENRAYEAIDARTKLERKQAAAERRRGRKEPALAQKLRYARQAEAKAIALAEDVALLARWLREDILSVAGPESAIRRELYDFVVAELRAREPACPHRIKPVRQLLENQRDDLLAFAVELDRDLAALARQWQIGECDRSRGPGDAGPAGDRPEAVAARGGAASDLEGALSRGVCRRGGVVRSGRARQQPGGEPQQPAAELLLPAAAPGGGLPGVAPVLPEPPAVSAERAPRSGWGRARRSC